MTTNLYTKAQTVNSISVGVGHRNSVAPAIPTFLPTVSASPSFVVGTTKLVSAYNGPAARVQRISDDVEADLSFGTKYMDVSGLTVSSHRYKTFYDQTGNGNHLVQATKANQPSASNLTFNNAPSVHFDSSPLAIGVLSKNMACTTGPVTEKSAFTAFLLMTPSFSFNDNYYFRQPHTATTLSIFTQSNNVGLRGNNTSPFNSTRVMPRIQPCVVRWRGSTAGKQFAVNGGTNLVSTAPAAGAETGIAVGSHSSTASFDGEFDLYALVIYNAALSDADCLLVETALYAQCNAPNAAASNFILFDGDSRTEGSGHSTANQTWPKELANTLNKPVHAINMGIGGQTLNTMSTSVAARVNALYSATYTKNIVVVGGAGINDFTANDTATNVQGYMTTYAAGLHANQTLVVATVPLRDTSTGAQNTERTTYNTWLRANYASLKAGTVLVDLDAIPQFATYSTTYWIDIVHFNWTGQQLWAAAFKPVIETLLV